MVLRCGIEVSDILNTKEKVFHIVTQDREIILCNLKDAISIIARRECYYASHFVSDSLVNIGENDIVRLGISS